MKQDMVVITIDLLDCMYIIQKVWGVGYPKQENNWRQSRAQQVRDCPLF